MKYYTFILLLIFVIGCTRNKQCNIPDTELNWNTDKIQYISNHIDTIIYISLNKNNYFANADKLLISNDTIFILDFIGTKKLVAFNIKGEFLFQVGARGRGRGEYLEIRNFTIKNNSIFCIDNINGRLMEYSKTNGEFINHFKMPIVADDIAVLNNDNFIFYLAKPMNGVILSKKQDECRVFITDINLKIKKSLFPYTEYDCNLVSQISALCDTGDEILISEYANDLIYSVRKDNQDSIKIYKFDFGKNKAPNKKSDISQLRYCQYISSEICAIDSLIIGSVNTPDEPFGVFMFNIKSSEKYINNIIDRDNKFFAHNYLLPIIGTYKDYLIVHLNSYKMYDELIQYGFSCATKDVELHLSDGNSVLMLYKLPKYMTKK